MLPSYKKRISEGVCTIFHGYGVMRGIPLGRQFASGSSFDMRSLVTFAASGRIGSVSPGFRALEMSYMKWTSGPQIPERSGLPALVRGIAAVDFDCRWTSAARAW